MVLEDEKTKREEPLLVRVFYRIIPWWMASHGQKNGCEWVQRRTEFIFVTKQH